jgi:O-antigen ligase
MSSNYVTKIKFEIKFLNILVFITFALFIGAISSPKFTLLLVFSSISLWIVMRREDRGGLGMLWVVSIEPAPSDLLFIWIWIKRLLSRRIRWPNLLFSHLLLAFVALNFLQLIWVSSWQRGLFFAGATAYTISLCFYFSSSIPNLQTWFEIRKYYLAAVLVATLIIIYLALIFFIGRPDSLLELYYGERPKGFFKDPNVAGPFVATGAIFAFSQFIFQKKQSPFWFLFIIFFITFLATFLTFSRGALINLFVGILTAGLIAIWLRRGLRFMVIAFIIALFMFLFSSYILYILEAFGQYFRFRGPTFYDIYGRLAAWQAGIRLFMDNPWGVGPGQFEDRLVPYFTYYAAHNMFLRVLVENGVLGFSVLFCAFMTLIMIIIKAIKTAFIHQNKFLMADIAWLSGSLMGIFVESFLIDTLHWRHFWIIIGFIIALFRISKRLPGENQT